VGFRSPSKGVETRAYVVLGSVASNNARSVAAIKRGEQVSRGLQGIAAAAAQARNKRADGPAANPRPSRGSHAGRVIGAFSG
jgi:hypothetical protein